MHLGIHARERYESTGEIITIPAASLKEEAAMQTKDTVEYYTKRAAVENYENSFCCHVERVFHEI